MAGLVQTQIDATKDIKTPDDPTQVKGVSATSYDPTLRAVDPNQTVAGQLDKVLASDSPLMTKARQDATEQSNARGLQNSSIAVGAGESAAIGAALPIAEQDASTYGQAAAQNVDTTNTALATGAAATNAATQYSAGVTNQQQQAKLQGEIETGLQTLRGTQATDLANIEANYKQLMQANSSASAMFDESMSQISTILRDPNTSAEQKSSAVTAVVNLLKTGLDTSSTISNMDFSGLLDFSNVTAAAAPPPAAPAPQGQGFLSQIGMEPPAGM